MDHVYADGAASHDISVTVTDDKSESDDAQTSIEVLNVAPTLSATGADAVDEGAEYTLHLSASDPGDDTITEWTIDWGDGIVETIVGNPPSVAHTYADGLSDPTIVATATDEDGTFGAEPLTITVSNVAPTLVLAGSSLNLDDGGQPIPFSGVRGQTLDFSGFLTDPGFDNLALNPATRETLTYTIDFGDGSTLGPLDVTDLTPGSPGTPTTGSFAVEHVYTSAGSYTLVVTVADDDGDATELLQTVTIAESSLQAGGDLAIGGTTGDDHLKLNQHAFDGTSSEVGVELSGTAPATVPAVNRILAFLQDGDDKAQVLGSLSIPVWIFGGPGDDHIRGGDGDDVLDGGPDHDLLIGGGGRDLLIGGEGGDRLIGNADDDILIAGWLSFAQPLTAIERIMSEWTSDHDLLARLVNLGGVNDGAYAAGLNDGYFLKAGETVESSDGAHDFLTGAQGDDWFFFDPDLDDDKATDLKNEVFANDLEFILGT